MEKLKQLARLLFERFTGRRDTYAIQLDDGSYRPVRKALTADVLEHHLEGERTVATYVPNEQGCVLFICFDFDRKDEETRRTIEALAAVLRELGFDPLREFSGQKGYHLLLMLNEPLDAKKAIHLGRAALTLAKDRLGAEIECELFPKSPRPPRLGNLVKVPLGKHRRGTWSRFLDERWEPYEDQLAALRAVRLATLAEVDSALEMLEGDKPSAPESAVRTPRTVYPHPLPCFRAMMKGVEEGCRDKVGFVLAKHMKGQGVDRAEAEALLKAWNDGNGPPLPKRQVLQKITQAYEKHYTSLDCEDPCIEQFCEPGCPLLEKRDPAEVSNMFLERAGRLGDEEGRRLAIATIPYVAKLPYREVMNFRDTFREEFKIFKKDFEKLIREAKRRAEKKAEKRVASAPAKGHVRRHLWEDEPHPLRQSLDYHRGATYTVIQVMDEIVSPPTGEGDDEVILDWRKNSYVITSEREMFPLTKEELRERGLYVEETEEIFTGSKWSKPSIRRFREEAYEVDPAEVFRKVRDNVAYYMEFDTVQGQGFEMPPEATVDLVALLIMVSWFVPVFDAIPYVFNHGEMASGKSKLARIQATLSFLGEWVTQGTTTAALKRLAAEGASLYFDNIENIQSREFDPDQRAIILASNTRGATVALVEEVGKRKVVRRLNVFGVKGFNNIGGLDEVLASRVIRIPLVRGTNATIMARDPDGTPPRHAWQELIDDLYVLAMTAMPRVKEAYDSVWKEGLEGREWQLWRPVFALAQVIDESDPVLGLEQEMEDLASAKRHEETQAGEVEDAYWILLALVKEVFLEGRTGPIPNHEVLEKAEALNPDLVTENAFGTTHHLISPTALGQAIKRLRVTRGSRRKVEGRTAWVYDARKLEARARSYGIDMPPLQRPLPNSDTPEGSEE